MSRVGAKTFAERYGRWALVAGASEGIGRAFCRQLAERGLDIVLVARREDRLGALAAELEDRFGVRTRTVPLDLARRDLVPQLRQACDDIEIGCLVYNAAHADIVEYLDQPIDDKLATIDVNCRGVVLLTSHFCEKMVARGRGAVVLMSSMSGWQGSAMVGSYAASKAFITVLGESLWAELRPHGVDVEVCVAGATLTPNFQSQTPAEKQKGAFPMQPDAVARAALEGIGNGPTLIPGRMNRMVYLVLGKLVSRRAAVRFFSRTTRGLYAESVAGGETQ